MKNRKVILLIVLAIGFVSHWLMSFSTLPANACQYASTNLEYIKSKIVNKVFNNYDLQGYFAFIIDKLKEFQPPSFDEDTNIFEEQLKDLFLENGDLEVILAFFFSYVTPKFAEIVNLRNKFFSMLNK